MVVVTDAVGKAAQITDVADKIGVGFCCFSEV